MTSSGTMTSGRPTDAVAMRAAVIDDFESRTRICDVPSPRPVLSEVLVRVVAAGVNPLDVKTSAGQGAAAGVTAWPAVLGCDFSGVVVEAPYEGFRLQPGDEVYGMTAVPRSSGSFAEYVAVPPQHLALKPKVLSHAEAAAVPLAALTAWGAVVELAKAHEGQRMLIHAGAGGVGHFAVQLAAYFGAHVIATGSPRNLGWLHELGATETIDYTAGAFEDSVEDVDVVIDLIGDRADHTGPRSLTVLRPQGLLVNVPTATWPTLMADAERAGVRATSFRVAPDAATLTVLARLITSGDLRVTVQDVFPFDRIDEALQVVEAGHVHGKVVVQVADY
jgi:NADPH:quinone reductase-like Zn-dependent oxidoreductase